MLPSAFLAVTVKLEAVPAVVGDGKPLKTKLLASGAADQFPSLSSTRTFEPAVTARSGRPSRLKSPTARPAAPAAPVENERGAWKVPLPLPRHTVTVE